MGQKTSVKKVEKKKGHCLGLGCHVPLDHIGLCAKCRIKNSRVGKLEASPIRVLYGDRALAL